MSKAVGTSQKCWDEQRQECIDVPLQFTEFETKKECITRPVTVCASPSPGRSAWMSRMPWPALSLARNARQWPGSGARQVQKAVTTSVPEQRCSDRTEEICNTIPRTPSRTRLTAGCWGRSASRCPGRSSSQCPGRSASRCPGRSASRCRVTWPTLCPSRTARPSQRSSARRYPNKSATDRNYINFDTNKCYTTFNIQTVS